MPEEQQLESAQDDVTEPQEDDQPQDDEEEGTEPLADDQSSEVELEPAAQTEESGQPEEITVTIEGHEEKDEFQSETFRDLRKRYREKSKENKELRKIVDQLQEPKRELGPKPKLEDFDLDTDKYEAALEEWYARKQKADYEAAKKKEIENQQEEQWQQKLDHYEEKKRKIPFNDYEEAEASFLDTFNQTQQGVLVNYFDNPAILVYALHKNPGKARELQQISDPILFGFALRDIEKGVKMSKKGPPPPEKQTVGTASKVGAVDSTLESLRREAAKTGNYSKVLQHKRLKRNQA